jgi:hypothetical protein
LIALERQYATVSKRVAGHEEVLDRGAQKLAREGTEVFRLAEDTANEVHFAAKSEQFGKLVDGARLDTQRDQIAKLLQESDDMLRFWESTSSKGQAEGAIKSLRKIHTDAVRFMSQIDPASARAGGELYIRADKFKRALDSFSQWGASKRSATGRYGLPEAITHETGIRSVADKWRAALEDETVWGAAGPAQAEWNASYSTLKPRRDHFGRELGVAIDSEAGIVRPEVDFKKVRSMLSELRGNDIDADLQAVKSTEAVIDGTRARVQKILEHGDITPTQKARLTEGLKELDEFQGAFNEARAEAAKVNRLKAQLADEQGKGMGGLLGLVTDAFTRPATTMGRLAEIRNTTRGLQKAMDLGFAKVFKSSSKYASSAGQAAEQAAPRAKAEVAKEIGEVKELAANPERMQERITRFVGDLPKHAPKIADEVAATATRAIYYLAKEAPPAGVRLSLVGVHNAKERYSDQQVAAWEAKRRAVLGAVKGETAPETLLSDMQKGRLNREAIQAIEFVSPRLFAQMQEMAWEELQRMESKGLLDAMPYQRKAAIASLLKVPPDRTWQPDFIKLMQGAKAMPAPIPDPVTTAPQNGASKRAIKMNTAIYSTEAGRIEGMVQ